MGLKEALLEVPDPTSGKNRVEIPPSEWDEVARVMEATTDSSMRLSIRSEGSLNLVALMLVHSVRGMMKGAISVFVNFQVKKSPYLRKHP
jgi:hypothetical protein